MLVQQQVEFAGVVPTLERPALFGNHLPTDTSQRVAKYFETSGFSRWSAIYGEGEIPPIWRVIRDGHDVAVNNVVDWVQDDGGRTALDAGCGTGNLAVRLAECGYEVDGFDVSPPMVAFARYITKGRRSGPEPRFHVGDIAALRGEPRSYDLVCCLDVLFHYPYAEVKEMLTKLANLSGNKIIGSFAIRTAMNAFWMEMGQRFFHKKNRMTSLHLLSYDQVEQVLYRAGFRVARTRRVKFFFYDSFVFEAVRR
ncbi:MAG: magnesium protoporphyrin IX methyltransferase [Candidatus Elarobacter sp.]